MLKTGIKGTGKTVVTDDVTAKAMGSGELPVYATPALIALIEETAWKSVADALEPDQGTVGTKVDIAHTAPTPVGRRVHCETELVTIDRRRLVFSATVFDESGKIAEGTHERFIVNNEVFLEKSNRR